MSCAIVSVCDRKNLPGLRLLDYTLGLHGNIPADVTRVLISDDLDSFPGWRLVRPRKEDYAGIPEGKARWRPDWAKARWKLDALLQPFDQVVILDVDLLCLGDVSELFAPTDRVRAALDNGIGPSKRINSGVVVVPNTHGKELRRTLIAMMRAGESFDGADQGAWQTYLAQHPARLDLLHQKYNVLKRIAVAPWAKDLWASLQGDIRLLHYVGRNPWQGGDPTSRTLDELWHKYEIRRIRECAH